MERLLFERVIRNRLLHILPWSGFFIRQLHKKLHPIHTAAGALAVGAIAAWLIGLQEYWENDENAGSGPIGMSGCKTGVRSNLGECKRSPRSTFELCV